LWAVDKQNSDYIEFTHDPTRRPSAQTTAMVLALAKEPSAWRYGSQLCQRLDLRPGSLYPILMWLADRGLLETTWDTFVVPAGRPPRHRYRRTWR
jgi:PadR family transcriptional regulator PadR